MTIQHFLLSCGTYGKTDRIHGRRALAFSSVIRIKILNGSGLLLRGCKLTVSGSGTTTASIPRDGMGCEYCQPHQELLLFFLVFISENYLASENCKDELSFVRDLKKNRVLAYLDQVALPYVVAMRLGRLQAIYWPRLGDEKASRKAYARSPGLDISAGEAEPVPVACEPPAEAVAPAPAEAAAPPHNAEANSRSNR